MRGYRVVSGYFVAGFDAAYVSIENREVIVRAAPVIKWTVGKYVDEITRYAENKGWTVEVLPTNWP